MSKMIDTTWVVVFLVAPIYPIVSSLVYKVGKLKEEVQMMREIIMKYVKLNGFK